MKKIAIIVIAILIGISSVFLTLNIVKYHNFQSEIQEKKDKVKSIQNDISKNVESNSLKENEYNELKKAKADEIKEVEKWQKVVEELEKAL